MLDHLTADIRRLSPSGRFTLRSLVAGLLSQGFQAILVFRLFNWLHRHRLPGQPLRFICERLIEITTGISIPACCSIGKGLRIHHFGGIIFHPSVVLGDNCTIYHGVTIGDRGGSGRAASIGNNVMIGAGAKIIGEISIGDNCLVGANTVVTKPLPANTIATGSPCRMKPRSPEELQPSEASNPIRIMDFRGTYKSGGGPDKTILNSAAQHDPHKVSLLVVYLRQPDDHAFQIPEMARQLGINYTDLTDHGLLDLQCLQQLRRLVRRHRIQLVHSHDDKTLLYAWLLRLLVPGLKIMHTCHSHVPPAGQVDDSFAVRLKKRLRHKTLIFLMKRHLNPIITVSHDTRHRLINSGIPDKAVEVLHNGIDLSFWQPDQARATLREELQLDPDAPLVGTVARITPEKDLPSFYTVAEQVAAQMPTVRFVIVGDGYGDELQKARDEVAGRNLSSLISFTGHRSDLRDLYASFDLFLMTSVTEGMPNTLLEAMAMGLPAVSTAVGGIPELLDQSCGNFLAPPGDADGLAGHVLQLLSDPELRETTGAACRRRVSEQFCFARRVEQMEAYYIRLAGTGCESTIQT